MHAQFSPIPEDYFNLIMEKYVVFSIVCRCLKLDFKVSLGTQKISKYSHSHMTKAVELLIPHDFEALLWILCQWTCTVSKMSHYTFIVAVHHKLHPSCSLFDCLLTKDP